MFVMHGCSLSQAPSAAGVYAKIGASFRSDSSGLVTNDQEAVDMVAKGTHVFIKVCKESTLSLCCKVTSLISFNGLHVILQGYVCSSRTKLHEYLPKLDYDRHVCGSVVMAFGFVYQNLRFEASSHPLMNFLMLHAQLSNL